MPEFTLRMASEHDVEDICLVWELSFGDEADTVRTLLLDAGLLGSSVVAERDGRVCSAMLSFDGLSFGGIRASYIYALCTHPDLRGMGMGSAVVKRTVQSAFDSGAELVCLHPASLSLSAWYQRILGMEALSSTVIEPAGCAVRDGAEIYGVTAAEYFKLRAHSSPSVPLELLKAQELFCSGSEGGLMRLDICGQSCCACTQLCGDRLLIRELVCPPDLRSAAASLLAEHFGAPAFVMSAAFGTVPGALPHLMGLWKSSSKRTLPAPAYLPFILD